jgi:hypothetical protein
MGTGIRRPVHRGSHLVRGLWFDCALQGETEARDRLLAAWEAGARAYRVQDGYLLEWKRARRLHCGSAPGLPLCEQDGVLTSAPLLAHERTGIAPGSAVLVLGATNHVHVLAPELRVDPSLWLDVSMLPLCTALAMPPGPAAGFVASAPEAAGDVRAALGDAVSAPSPRRAEFLRKARQAREHSKGRAPGLLGAAATATLAAAALATGALGALFILPIRLLGSSADAGAARGTSGTAGGAAQHGEPAPSRLRDWLANRMAGLAALTRVSRVLGWRQAGYLRKMLRQFEEGNLDEALRHAIPLDSQRAATRPMLGTPGRRDSLEIGPRRGSTVALGLDSSTVEFLRSTYQRSFDKLDRAGRIDEAAFVLAELMNRHQEAVDYLERKGRVAQAARLAETLELAPALIVRLHCMAGDVARAILLARLTDCFGEAVAELERRKHPEAGALRLQWAEHLAARGSLVEAARAVWPLKEERGRARTWLHAAEHAGGALGVQGLLYKLALDPEARPASAQAVHALLYEPGEEAARDRVRAADCLIGMESHDKAHDEVLRRLAAELWRALLADRTAALNALPQERLAKLVALAADPALDADAPAKGLPGLPRAEPLTTRSKPLHLSFAERGLLPLEDVRRLPDGGYLLALGEGGVLLARADGNERLRFPVPAHHLVLAEGGQRALALARRERSSRVSRLDLVARKADDWFSAPLDFWAHDYDGTSWSVVAENRLMALDTAAAGQSVLWQVRDLPGRVAAFERQDRVEAMLLEISMGETVEQWRYALPQRRLMGREQIGISEDACAVLPDCRGDQAISLMLRGYDGQTPAGSLVIPGCRHGRGGTLELRWSGAPPQLSLHDGMLLLRFQREDGWHCQLITFNCVVLADVVLPEAQEPRAALRDGCLMVWDQRGRLVEVELATSSVRMLTLG